MKFKNRLISMFMTLFVVVGLIVSFGIVSATDDFTYDKLNDLIVSNQNGIIDLPANRTIFFKGPIKINKDLKINGNNLLIKNSEGESSPNFIITGGGSLVLSDITFDKGHYPVQVQKSRSLVCQNCVFNSCKGSIQILGGNVRLFNSSVGWGSIDPQIMIEDESKLDVYDSKFHHNSMGSSIFCYGKSEVQIVNSTFDQNSAIQGGALYFSHARDLNIKNCAVTNNFANVSGGFLYVDGCDKINLDNNKFASNSANIEKENIRDSAGGACMFLSGLFNCSIRGNAFFSNRDNNDGSVIAVNTNSYSSIYGRENIIDGSARFGDYIYLINSPHLNLDVKG